MLGTGWSVGLTILLVVAGGYCLWAWAQRTSQGVRSIDPEQLTHLNHTVMSVLMLVMLWRPSGELGSLLQAAIFGVFAGAQLLYVTGAQTAVRKIDATTQVVMNLAMVWMLLAMPLLMAGPAGGGGASHHGGDEEGPNAGPVSTPLWAEAVNWFAIAMCGAVAAWWLVRMAKAGTHRWHYLCQALGAVAMALMLVLM